jgi:hypothetical protein
VPIVCRRRYFDLISQPGFDHQTFNLDREEGDKKPDGLDLHREFIGKAIYPAWQPLPFNDTSADSDDGDAGKDATGSEVVEKRGTKRNLGHSLLADDNYSVVREWKRQRAKLAEEMMLIGSYMDDDEGEFEGQDGRGVEGADQEAEVDDGNDDGYNGNLDPRLRRPTTSEGKGKGKARS